MERRGSRHHHQRVHRITATFAAVLLVHFAAIGWIAHVRSEGPMQELRVSTRSDSVVLFGHDRFGFSAFKHFENWNGLLAYLESRHIALPEIKHARPGLSRQVQVNDVLASDAQSKTTYKVTWGDVRTHGVLYAPDALAANAMADFVRYQGLVPSPIGYSLVID